MSFDGGALFFEDGSRWDNTWDAPNPYNMPYDVISHDPPLTWFLTQGEFWGAVAVLLVLAFLNYSWLDLLMGREGRAKAQLAGQGLIVMTTVNSFGAMYLQASALAGMMAIYMPWGLVVLDGLSEVFTWELYWNIGTLGGTLV